MFFQTIAQNFIKEAQAKYKDKIVVEVDFTSEAFKLDDSGIFSDCCCQQNWSGEGSKYVLACRGLPPKVFREGIYQVFDIVLKSFSFNCRARRKQPRDVWSQSSATDKRFHVKPFLWILYLCFKSNSLYWFDTGLCCAWDQLWIVNMYWLS